jgi:hypothetical protein
MTHPQPGDKILVLKWHWLQLILDNTKTMEIRGIALRRGRYFLGFKQSIYGWVEFGDPLRIQSVAQWLDLRHRHCVPSPELPYKKTYGCPILCAEALSRPIPYTHPKGAVCIVKYR